MRLASLARALLSVLLATALAAVPAGCERRPDEPDSMIQQGQTTTVVAVTIDCSGSFSGRLDDAFTFFAAAADEYFRGSIGEPGHVLVVSQISGNGKALLWEGHPADLRKRFRDAAAFRAFILSRADTTSSRVHDAVADTLEDVLSRPGVEEGKVRSAVLILSDMDENASSPDSLRRVTGALKRYHRAKGAVGIYWCDQSLAGRWRSHLKDAGFDGTNSVVVSEIRDRPPLPRLGY